MQIKGEVLNVVEQGDPDKEDSKESIYWAYVSQGNDLLEQARQSSDESLFQDSFDKYARAIEIKPENHEAYFNWGNALLALAKLSGDKNNLLDAASLTRKVRKINPDKVYYLICARAQLDKFDMP